VIRAQPGEDKYWHALGDMNLVSKPKEAQHTYIRALEIISKVTCLASRLYGLPHPRIQNVEVWTSLGFFCFYHDDLELASEAFLKAQTLDPDHTVTWVGHCKR
jgi:superkiller protein 3